MSRRNGKTTKASASALVEAMRETKGEGAQSPGRIMELPEMKDGLSSEELALEIGVGVKTMRERLKARLNEGSLVVGRKQTKDLMGRPVWVPCYKMIERAQ